MRKEISRLTAMTIVGAMMLSACASSGSTAGTTAARETTSQISESQTAETAETTEAVKETSGDADTESKYAGYSLVWSDEFSEGKLSEADWNYEIHEPGWVNNELQSYVKSDNNIYIEDGKLVIKPLKAGSGYTSGRVNTQGKHDFTYGIMEASIKMPAGKGFLPAFWMMASDENLYGQWPRCGEIDIAEVLGNNTKKTYGTIHYGNPHSENQGTYTLTEGDFSEEFHTYAVEWLPGEIRWYVDGIEIYSTSDWYSTTEGLGTVTYPAPFDQPFYIILNLAVGGNWPGNPDATTDIDNAKMEIDYVRVYQKDSYDENVTKPVQEVTLRDPDADGNYINNGDFAEAENLNDENDWNFLTALEGKGSAEIKDNTIIVTTENAGTADYSIQLVHWKVPMQEGAKYRITFDAWADADRQMKVGITAPEHSWGRYFQDTLVDITTEKKSYSFEFIMKDSSDAAGRLEFNMGNLGSKETVYITNVRIEKLSENNLSDETKTVLSDGNYVYNASFREGDKRVGYWEFDGDSYEVTSLTDGRRLHVSTTDSKLTVTQSDLAIAADSAYMLSFEAEGNAPVTVKVNGKEEVFDLDAGMNKYSLVFTYKGADDANDISFIFPEGGEFYLDNVQVVENVMVKNGSFNAGMSGYEVYIDNAAAATYVVDSLSEDNAIDFTVKNTGTADWNIQLKQNYIKLEKGKTYTLKFDAKSDMEREIRVVLQGGEDLGWPVYSTDLNAPLSSEYQTFKVTFTMEANTDAKAFLSFCLGAVGGNKIDKQHRICIDNISLIEE